jgi:hypothetical protein
MGVINAFLKRANPILISRAFNELFYLNLAISSQTEAHYIKSLNGK